jgi:hypothetical protein
LFFQSIQVFQKNIFIGLIKAPKGQVKYLKFPPFRTPKPLFIPFASVFDVLKQHFSFAIIILVIPAMLYA